MSNVIVGLLTDFGMLDSYVAQMKLVIASRSGATLVDLSHDIPPQDVVAAGLFLREIRAVASTTRLTRRMITVVVVDPGVGTERRILCVRNRLHTILAPDNGIVPLAFSEPPDEIRNVGNEGLFLNRTGRTFHGRDRFAPVAAALAEGLDHSRLGEQIRWRDLVRVGWRNPEYGDEEARGTIVTADRFGNLITDLQAERLQNLAPYEMIVGDRTISMIQANYADAGRSSEPFLIVGSRDTLEIAVNRGSAAALLQPERFEEVIVRSTKREV